MFPFYDRWMGVFEAASSKQHALDQRGSKKQVSKRKPVGSSDKKLDIDDSQLLIYINSHNLFMLLATCDLQMDRKLVGVKS